MKEKEHVPDALPWDITPIPRAQEHYVGEHVVETRQDAGTHGDEDDPVEFDDEPLELGDEFDASEAIDIHPVVTAKALLEQKSQLPMEISPNLVGPDDSSPMERSKETEYSISVGPLTADSTTLAEHSNQIPFIPTPKETIHVPAPKPNDNSVIPAAPLKLVAPLIQPTIPAQPGPLAKHITPLIATVAPPSVSYEPLGKEPADHFTLAAPAGVKTRTSPEEGEQGAAWHHYFQAKGEHLT